MKILLATDGSVYSKAAVEEIARRTYPSGTKVSIISAYENTPLIISAPAPMVVPAGDYEKTGIIVKRLAENTVQNAAELLKKKNPGLSISTAAINGSPKYVILNEAKRTGADLIVVGSHASCLVRSRRQLLCTPNVRS